MPGYPIELNLEGRPTVVVGLGPVGVRKALGLVEAGAAVTGVDPCPVEAPPGVRRVVEPFRPAHLDGACLAIACATVEVNRKVVRAARKRGIWASSATEPDLGDFLVPAVERRGRVTLAVSTGGASPGLAALVRDAAAAAIGPEVVLLAELVAELRPEVLARVSDPAVRRRLLGGWASGSGLELIRVRGADEARRTLRRELDAAAVNETPTSF